MKYTIQTHDEATYNHSRIVSKNHNVELNWSILIKIEVKTADLVINDVWGSVVDQSKTVYRNDITCLVMVFSYVANYSRNVFKSALNQSTLIFNLEMHSDHQMFWLHITIIDPMLKILFPVSSNCPHTV